ncbi:hypothetical protein TrCOL_g10845 [Triparma columacea]|uniref:Uncharacterized protein n=1 Tax=Triparma columacea TaxID=722753 RepID=A0A9W7L7F0_9STRA|nr:hypothetical protein TrCOL_g10845 [Triparma columacea]
MDEFEGSALEQAKHNALRARVDSWRALKLNGTLVNYTQSRRGKSTIEKLYKEPDVLKMYLKGYNSLSSTSLPKTVDRYIPPAPQTPSSKYDNIPSNLVSIIQRVTPGRELYNLLEAAVVRAFKSSSEETYLPWSDTVSGVRVDCFFVSEVEVVSSPENSMESAPLPLANVTFTLPNTSDKEFSAFCRIWLHSVSHFHGLQGRSAKGKGGRGGRFVLKGRVGGIEGLLTDEVKRRIEV